MSMIAPDSPTSGPKADTLVGRTGKPESVVGDGDSGGNSISAGDADKGEAEADQRRAAAETPESRSQNSGDRHAPVRGPEDAGERKAAVKTAEGKRARPREHSGEGGVGVGIGIGIGVGPRAEKVGQASANTLRINRQGKELSSKSDFVKVKVFLGRHYHVLSRFIIARMLTFVQVSPKDAVRISLQVKKSLVKAELTEISHERLERELFVVMQSCGYGQAFIARYHSMLAFHRQRVPLVILVSGSGLVGKSLACNQLASRLNLPTVLQTSSIYELACCVDPALNPAPLHALRCGSKAELVSEFDRRCRIVREGRCCEGGAFAGAWLWR